MATRGPIIRMHQPVTSKTGIGCFCFRCCTCINMGFLNSPEGILKIAQVILGFLCQSLCINFGMGYAASMGTAFHSFLTTVSWSLMTSFLLLICYAFSANSFTLLRQSMFEFLFNSVAAFSYISSSLYLALSVTTILQPQYLLSPYSQSYPAMTTVYMVGLLIGILYAYDATKAYKQFKGYQ